MNSCEIPPETLFLPALSNLETQNPQALVQAPLRNFGARDSPAAGELVAKQSRASHSKEFREKYSDAEAFVADDPDTGGQSFQDSDGVEVKSEPEPPIPPLVDGFEVTRRLVEDYADHDIQFTTPDSTSPAFDKIFKDVVESTLTSITAVQHGLEEQMQELHRLRFFTLKGFRKWRNRASRLKATAASVRLLKPLGEHIQTRTAHPDTNMRALDDIREIYLIVESVLSLLSDPAQDDSSISGLLSDFKHAIIRYLTHHYVGSPRALLKVTASSSTETNPDICLLEKAFTDFLRDRTRKSKQHGLTTFTAWARMENIDSTISQNVGPVASTTLYRVTRGVIRHEFTIIGFHSGEAAMSWLRTERTARVKEGWINPDSFGPVFSGVEARDLVSFASSKEALIGRNVEEVAEVVNLENEPTIIRNGIYLSELAESLAAVSNHYPRYSLLATNCRYFARRIVLNFAHRLDTIKARSRIKYRKGILASFPKLAEKILEERFGGSHVGGEQGVLSHAEDIFGLGQSHSNHLRYTEALECCRKAVALLLTLPHDNFASRTLIGRCYTLECWSLRNLHRFSEAYLAGNSACEVLRICVRGDIMDYVVETECLAYALYHWSQACHEFDRKDEAVECSQEVVKTRRLLLNSRDRLEPYYLPDYIRYSLGYALSGLSFHLSEVGKMTEAITTGEEGIQILRAMYIDRPDILGHGLAAALHNHSVVLAAARRTAEACAVAVEAVELRRGITVIPERHREGLAIALYTYALHAATLKQWDISITADKESIELYRSLDEYQPNLYDSEIIRGLLSHVKHLKQCRRLEDALVYRRDHVKAARTAFEKEPKLRRSDFARILYHYGIDAATLKNWGEAIQADLESLQHYQILAAEDETFSDDVIDAFMMLAKHLSASDRKEESINYRRQQIAGLLDAFAKNRDRRADLAAALYDLSIGLVAVERWDEAAMADRDALEHYRVLADLRPKQYEANLMYVLGNYAKHLARAGRMEDALVARREHTVRARGLFDECKDRKRRHQYGLELANGLYNLAIRASGLKHWKEAIAADQSALVLYQGLAEDGKGYYAVEIAETLRNYADHLGGDAQHEKALEVRRELLGAVQALYNSDPDRHCPSLAKAWYGMANDAANLKLWKESISADKECVRLFQQLAGRTPEPYVVDYITCLDTMVDHLRQANKPQDALQMRRDQVECAASAFADKPELYRQMFALALYDLAYDCAALDRLDEAVAADAKCLELYRHLAKDQPEKYTTDFLDAVSALSKHLISAGKAEDALPYQREQFSMLQALFDADPDTYCLRFADAAYRYAAIADADEAVLAIGHAVELYRHLAKREPETYSADVLAALGNAAFYYAQVGRREEGLVFRHQQITALQDLFDKDPDTHRASLAAALLCNGEDAAGLELWDEALIADEHAVRLWRPVVQRDRQTRHAEFIHALDTFAHHLCDAGLPAEAFVIRGEQVELLRYLYTLDPDTHRADLAEATYDYGHNAAALKRWEDSVMADEESLRLYFMLAAVHPERYALDLVAGHSSLSRDFSGSGNLEAALDHRRAQITKLRTLFHTGPDTHRADLAFALYQLGCELNAVQSWDESIAADYESLELYQHLAETNPPKYGVDVVDALDVLTRHLRDAGRLQEALHIRQKQVAILRPALASQDPKSHLTDLGQALCDLAATAYEAESWDEAIEADNESLAIYKNLAQDHPEEYNRYVTDALNNLASHLSGAERRQEAHDVLKEHLAIVRSRFAQDPEEHREALAAVLYDVGENSADLELWDESIAADAEALRLYRDLEKVDPDRYGEDAMSSLGRCASHLQNAGRGAEAIPYFRDQLVVARALFIQHPASHRENFARVLFNFANGAGSLHLWEDSIAAAGESLELYRILADNNPKFISEVVDGLECLARHLEAAGRQGEALVHRREQITLLRTLVQKNPSDIYHIDLARALHRMALDDPQSAESQRTINL